MRGRLGRARDNEQQETTTGGGVREVRQKGRIAVQPRRLLVVLGLLLLIVLIAFDLQALLPQEWVALWPWALTVVGAVLLLGGMVTANAIGTLVGPLIAVLGAISLLDLTADTPNMTVISGGLVVALGLGVLLRGFTQTRI